MTGRKASDLGVKPYDGAVYRLVSYVECDCGHRVRTGPMNADGSYPPGAKEMVQHLVDKHGYVRPYTGGAK